jgi:hypothetical protein
MALTQATLLNRDATRGQQDLLYKALWTVGDHRLRIRRRRNAYAFQSHAVVERWNGEEWRKVESIPYESMATSQGDSYVSRNTQRPNKAELDDERELLRRACLVLGLDPVAPEVHTPDHGNVVARSGYDRCDCGCKYWEQDRCIDCGFHLESVELRDRREADAENDDAGTSVANTISQNTKKAR